MLSNSKWKETEIISVAGCCWFGMLASFGDCRILLICGIISLKAQCTLVLSQMLQLTKPPPHHKPGWKRFRQWWDGQSPSSLVNILRLCWRKEDYIKMWKLFNKKGRLQSWHSSQLKSCLKWSCCTVTIVFRKVSLVNIWSSEMFNGMCIEIIGTFFILK